MRIKNTSDSHRYFPYAGSGLRNGVNLAPGAVSPDFPPARVNNPVLRKDLAAKRIQLVCQPGDRHYVAILAGCATGDILTLAEAEVPTVAAAVKGKRVRGEKAAPQEAPQVEAPAAVAAAVPSVETVVEPEPAKEPKAETAAETPAVETAVEPEPPKEKETKAVEVPAGRDPAGHAAGFSYPDHHVYARYRKDELNARLDHLALPHNPSAKNSDLVELLVEYDKSNGAS